MKSTFWASEATNRKLKADIQDIGQAGEWAVSPAHSACPKVEEEEEEALSKPNSRPIFAKEKGKGYFEVQHFGHTANVKSSPSLFDPSGFERLRRDSLSSSPPSHAYSVTIPLSSLSFCLHRRPKANISPPASSSFSGG